MKTNIKKNTDHTYIKNKNKCFITERSVFT